MLRELRADLRERVERLAVERAGLPRDAGVFVKERERRWKRLGLGRVEGGVRGWLGFVNPRRRRKKGAFTLLASLEPDALVAHCSPTRRRRRSKGGTEVLTSRSGESKLTSLLLAFPSTRRLERRYVDRLLPPLDSR